MHAAWRFVREYGFSMSEAMKQAWMQFKLRARMTKGAVEFYFKKKNGELRRAIGTLVDVPATGNKKVTSQECQTYYDLTVNDWRCYRLENLLEVK